MSAWLIRSLHVTLQLTSIYVLNQIWGHDSIKLISFNSSHKRTGMWYSFYFIKNNFYSRDVVKIEKLFKISFHNS